jgi:hypothetical protein
MSFSRTAARKAVLRRFLTPIALAAVAGIGVAGVHAPAMAQKKKEQAAPKASYSKEFIAAYKPIETQANAAGADFNALKASVPSYTAAATTADDKHAAGRMTLMIGQKTNDYALALQGLEMMLASGRADPASLGQFNFAAGQFAYNLKDYAKARTYIDAAIKAGYTQNDPQLLLAEAYFAEKQYAPGLKVLSDAMAARKAAGQPVPEAWLKRGLATAYSNNQTAEAHKWALMYARDFPSQTSWGDAIAIAINTGNYQPAEMLDLLRLARRTNTLRTKAMYLEYIDAADARKLPNEVVTVLDAGTAAKVVDNNIQLVKDARSVATSRIAADKAELPALLRDANGAGAKLVTVMAAADTLLSYGRSAEAEKFYAKAAAMPGANVPLVLTRMGIAQADQGKFADAQATFAKVTGPRQQIASLWALYAAQKAGGTTVAAVTTTGG